MASKDITYEDFKKVWEDSLPEEKIRKMWEETKSEVVEKYQKGEIMSPEAKKLAIQTLEENGFNKSSPKRSPRRSTKRSPRRSSKNSPKRSPIKNMNEINTNEINTVTPEEIEISTTVLSPRSPSPIRSVRKTMIKKSKIDDDAPIRMVIPKKLAIRFLFPLPPKQLFPILNASPELAGILPLDFWERYYFDVFGPSYEFGEQTSTDPDVWMKMTRNRYYKNMNPNR